MRRSSMQIMMPASSSGEHAGWIYKQGSLVKNWKKRFMVLRGKQLTYYDSAQVNDDSKAKGSFQVITVELSNEIHNGLIVHGRNGRVLKLYTDSADATSGWYNAIMDATTGGAGDRISVASGDRYSVLSNNQSDSVDVDEEIELLDRMESVSLGDTQVRHSGWLMKEGGLVKNWKRRYFQLRGNTLSYFDTEDIGAAAKGFGHVQSVEVDDGTKANSLAVQFDNGRLLRVTADSQNEMQEWLCKISDAIECANFNDNNARQSIMARARSSMSVKMPSMRLSSKASTPVAPVRHSIASVPSGESLRRLDSNRVSSSSGLSYSHSTSHSLPEASNELGEDGDSDDSEGDWL
ncbi:TPA: hypothetical protein N0F65_006380 [Lagenidium giganteum]|uniref:PH domain-containing protein n=1 Tax=Lagenidium giganteum TaxID=4803 RepID=A0AAV2YSN4_9STRA|nr:TPA: hypothetical protein N0F65_006380 [Lagenidium giganteum]